MTAIPHPLHQIALPLFVPGHRMDRLAKACDAGADAVIVDLEDAVAPDDKIAARSAMVAALAQAQIGPIILRINGIGTPWHADDLAACSGLPLTAIMLPKAEDAAACTAISDSTGLPVVALIESARGIQNVQAIASASARLAFGSIDYAADLGLAHTPIALQHARAALVLAARLADQPAPWDGVTTAVKDNDAIAQDCAQSVDMGFAGKLLIHPAQVGPARQGFAPTDADRDWAERVLAAAGDSAAAIMLDGQMIDAPVVLRARAILARAAAAQVTA